jgi:hypothetical protein
MSRVDGEKVLSGIRANQKPHHDTLYCNERYKKALLSTINGMTGGARRADNLQVSGLEVVTHEGFDYPITCERGEVFDLAEDFKCGNAKPTDI